MSQPRPSTFSIVARDSESDAVGIAVQSKFISVGSVVPFAAADAGAIATQSAANVAYGPEGLAALRDGTPAMDVRDALVAEDRESHLRQIGIVGQDGSVAAFTGEDCHAYAGDVQGDGYTVQGNILENRETLTAMAKRYETTDGGFPERLIAALHAGNEAGGDKRGEQSAALYIVKPDGGYGGRNDRWIDVRVDDHDRPIAELERVFKLYDITLLEREEPDNPRTLSDDAAQGVLETLSALGYYDGEPTGPLDGDARASLKTFQEINNFENHSIELIEDALARGWSERDRTLAGSRQLIDVLWKGLSVHDRR